MHENHSHTSRTIVRSWLTVLGAVLLTSIWSTSGSLDNLDAQRRLRVADQVLREHRLVVESRGDSIYNSTFRDRDGAYASYFGFGQSLYFLPFEAGAIALAGVAPVPPPYRAKLTRSIFAVSVFFAGLIINYALCAACARRLGLTTYTAHLVAFGAVFGSSFWQMTKQQQEEVQLSMLVLLGLYGFLHWRRTHQTAYLWLSAAAAAAAVVFRPTAITILVGVAGMYAWELRRLRCERSLHSGVLVRVVGAFLVMGAAALLALACYNAFKTGHPLRTGYSRHQGTFEPQNWWYGVIGPTIGVDRGIIWQDIWVLPLTIVLVARWRRVTIDVRIAIALAAFLLLSSVALHASWSTWAGDHTYGARFQQHVVPLLGVVLGPGLMAAARLQVRSWGLAVPIVFGLAALQVPSVALVYNLEILQALAEGASARPGATVTAERGGQIPLRYRNLASKLTTGAPVPLDTVRWQDPPIKLLQQSSRWDFWPWRLDADASGTRARAARALWAAVVLASVLVWSVVLRRA